MARVKFKGKNYFLGTFDDELEAAAVADAKRRELMPFYVPVNERHSPNLESWDTLNSNEGRQSAPLGLDARY
jgi:hypothetical protein